MYIFIISQSHFELHPTHVPFPASCLHELPWPLNVTSCIITSPNLIANRRLDRYGRTLHEPHGTAGRRTDSPAGKSHLALKIFKALRIKPGFMMLGNHSCALGLGQPPSSGLKTCSFSCHPQWTPQRTPHCLYERRMQALAGAAETKGRLHKNKAER